MSVGAPHFCQQCGFDFWRSAAAESPTLRALPTAPAAAGSDRRMNAAMVTAGVAGLLVAGIATAMVMLNGEGSSGGVPNTRPSRGPEDFLVERFFREVRSPSASFAYEGNTVLTQEGQPESATVATSTTMHGEDWYTTSTVTEGDETVTTTVAEVDGVTYLDDEESGGWVQLDLPDNGPDSPFALISTVGEIHYEGKELVDGVMLHHLVTTKWMGGTGTDFRRMGFDSVAEREGVFDVWVDDDGVPIRARQRATFTVTLDGETAALSLDGEFTFSSWGEIDPLEPPGLSPDDPQSGQGPGLTAA